MTFSVRHMGQCKNGGNLEYTSEKDQIGHGVPVLHCGCGTYRFNIGYTPDIQAGKTYLESCCSRAKRAIEPQPTE